MIRRLITVSAAILALICANASAAEYISAYSQDNSYTVAKEDWMGEKVIISDYDKNGSLIGCGMYTAENGVFTIPANKLSDLSRAWFPVTDEVLDVKLAKPSATEAPEPTSQPTEAPETTLQPTAAPDLSYPAVYGKELNAVNAFAVVNDVVSATVDGEECFEVSLFFQGRETTVVLPADLPISSPSDEFSYMDGKNAGALMTGDVIFTRKDLFGEYAVLSLIYRPLDAETVLSDSHGASFEKLISAEGKVAWSVMRYGSPAKGDGTSYAFGVVYERLSGELALIGPDGNTNDALYIPTQNDTIVYRYDASVRNNPLSVERVSSIRGISGAKPDDNGFITYGDASKYTYALVRTIDGTATDIVVFTNYR